jgi:adenine-specific DNA-methyltransferase
MAQIQFKGKAFVQNHHLLVKYHELVPVKSKSLTDEVSLRDNLIIHGDNLAALKALLPMYAGKVKCVYIDPPYNTGNENWAYNDNVNSPMMQDWLGKVVDREDLTRHDKWLCMMMPRLKLLRELLTDDGVIYISIDENEVHRLMMVMDEIFGEENFLALLARRVKSGGGSAATHFAIEHDHVLAWAKSKSELHPLFIPHDEDYAKRYSEKDAKGRFFWDTMERSYTQTTPYKIKAPDGTLLEGDWFRSENRFEEDLESGEVRFLKKQDGSWSVQFKQRIGEGRKIRSLMHEKEFKSSYDELESLGLKDVFVYPKPTHLVRTLVRAACSGRNDIVLDSFAGSGTTGHAVLSLNKEDGRNRRFVLIECEDYADTITAERVRRVVKGFPAAKDEALKKGLGGSFSFFELGKPIELESILDGTHMPTYKELARYVFYTATGEEFDEKAVDEKKNFVGESRNYQVYLFYEPDVEKLKNMALTLDMAKALPPLKKDKRRLVFAPTKYLDQDHLDQFRIDFAQLPFEIYELTR